MHEGLFVPPAPSGFATRDLMEEVDRRWNALRAANPSYFDGRLCHVLGVHRNGHGGASLHVMDCAYRFFAVQAMRGDEFDLGVRPLGVKGVIQRDGRYLMGMRSPRVAMYQRMWEFAPSGSVEFGSKPEQVIAHELHEETGMACIGEPVAFAVLFDPVLKCWEIVYRLVVSADAEPDSTDEYPEAGWFSPDKFPTNMSPIARQIAALLTA